MSILRPSSGRASSVSIDGDDLLLHLLSRSTQCFGARREPGSQRRSFEVTPLRGRSAAATRHAADAGGAAAGGPGAIACGGAPPASTARAAAGAQQGYWRPALAFGAITGAGAGAGAVATATTTATTAAAAPAALFAVAAAATTASGAVVLRVMMTCCGSTTARLHPPCEHVWQHSTRMLPQSDSGRQS